MKDELLIYPNPATGIINILGNFDQLNEVRLFNHLGKDLTNDIEFSLDENSQKLKLDLTPLKAGLYIVKSNSKAYKIHKK